MNTTSFVRRAVSMLIPAAFATFTSFTSICAHAQVATDWPTFGMNKQRIGYNAAERVLGVGSVAQLRSHWATDIGGPITTQPTLATGVLVNGVPTDVVYAATWLGRIVALNAATGAVIWSVQAPTVQTDCADFNASNRLLGTIGTPTIDRATNRLYVVTGFGFLHALDLATGADVLPWVQLLDPANGSPRTFVYGSPTLNGSDLYVATASRCDVRPYHGQVIRVSTTNFEILQRWFPSGATGPDGGGIWGPGGISVTPNGLWLYTATGNSFSDPENLPYSEHVVRLTPSLVVDAADAPAPPPPGSRDVDFGATPLLFQTPNCPPMLAALQKSGMMYVYNRNALANGPINSFLIGQTGGSFNGIPAFDPVLNQIYVSSGSVANGLVALSVHSDCSIARVWNLRVRGNSITPPIPPVAANGVVYYVSGVASEVFAVDARSGQQLWSTASLPVADRVTGGIFASPTVVNGRLFVAGFDHKIHAYGL
ncbi:outer membrane protein assembly factor BamB family protein [Caballeronia humi]|uniref:Outer membrane biogenesis protein BamB n=1 Tax=Caballeronia humi TaxID=326474 RepID=A0A158HW40_9BURK|nr:PQQ-binding-like beta-propeller repeat protein [Caballeronia humi]SAL48367.1 outer membrane biogenesis protein BamB [Caballeronia humi]